MDIKTLESFSLGDAIFFHDELNKNLWDKNNEIRPEVKNQLLVIAKDFLEELGIKDLDVKDVTVSGSNAAYTYTKHSDLDLHILVDMSKLPDNEVYRELFTAKKNLYNDSHDITVHGVPVELYVQDSNEPVVSLGEYSLLKNKWLRIPTKRRANFDQTITKQKYDKLLDIIQRALKSKDLEKVQDIISTIKRYRKAGLDKGGEFGPENLAYKALRTQGYIDKLYNLRDKLHSIDLSIEENILYKDPKQLIDLYLRKIEGSDLSRYTLTKILKNLPYNNLDNAINFLSNKYKIKPTDIVWQPSDKTNEDFDPNGPPPGPEFKPTMPKGTVRVDVSDVYDWYKLGQHISNMKGLGKHDFGKGPPSTILSFGDEDTEHQYIKDLEKTGLTTTDIDPIDPHQPKGMKRQKVDPTFNVNEKINPEVVKSSFHAEKDINIKGVGPLKLKAFNISTNYPQQFRVEVLNSDNMKIGYFRFVVHDYEKPRYKIFSRFLKQPDPYLMAGNASVWGEYQKKGIATEVYKWVKSMGNDIKPSPYQTDAGKAMWRGFNKSDTLDTIKETINLELWKGGKPFQSHFATIGGYQFEARPSIYEQGTEDERNMLMIIVRDPKLPKGRQIIGHADFAVNDHGTNQWLESDGTTVNEKYRGKNIAYMMYAFAKSLGNDISPSFAQTTMGKKMWAGWGKDAENLVGEDLTLQFAAEKTPAINPYGGLKDKQFRGAISEMPDTSGPVGVQPGGWRTSKPRNIEVDEAFNQPYMLKWERGQFGDIDAYVKLPDGTNLSIMFNKETNKMWHVEFHRGESQEVTKQGDSLRIFGTVLGAIQQFVKRVKPKYIKLLAVKDTPQPGQKTPDRPGLYDNLINRYAPAMGYTVKRRENPGTVVWEFAKIKSVAEGASGYIPSNSEKNDPRFKTALTVDVRPDTMKKDAKKFGNKISRAGIPPTLNPSGKF